MLQVNDLGCRDVEREPGADLKDQDQRQAVAELDLALLVAEDDANIRETLADLLSGEGYDVKTAADGEAAIAAWRGASEPFDLVMLDVMMPGKSGYDVCREIRAAGSRVAVLMLSAKGEEIDKVIGLELGADDYVTKPFGVRELLARVAAAIRRAEGPSGAVRAETASESDFPFCGVRASVKRYVLEGPGGCRDGT